MEAMVRSWAARWKLPTWLSALLRRRLTKNRITRWRMKMTRRTARIFGSFSLRKTMMSSCQPCPMILRMRSSCGARVWRSMITEISLSCGCCRTECVSHTLDANLAGREMRGSACRRRGRCAMKMVRAGTIAIVLLTGASGLISGQGGGGIRQNPPQPMPGRGNIGLPPIDGRDLTMDPLGPRLEEQQARTRNNERQKRLVADTNKLLSLATDLKQQLDKTNTDVLSVDVVKKAEEIEKLAKSVKDRMKG